MCLCCRLLQCVAVRCSVIQFDAVCCNALQCVAVCCSVLQWRKNSSMNAYLHIDVCMFTYVCALSTRMYRYIQMYACTYTYTYNIKLCHAYQWLMWNVQGSHVTYVDDSCQTCAWVMPLICMSHTTHMNEVWDHVGVSLLFKTAFTPGKREGNVRVATNLHDVDCSARRVRPRSMWAVNAHRIMGKTQ